MIGQNEFKELCQWWNDEPKNAPALLVLFGRQGMGKKTAVEYIRKNVKNDGMLKAEDNSVSTVRAVIDKSYQLGGTVYYVFTDCDNMSVQAKNALLKVMEEPPQGARFIITAKSSSSVLETVMSRAFVYNMAPYSEKELKEFVEQYKKENKIEGDTPMYYFLSCPGDFVRMFNLPSQGSDLVEYAESIADYIGEVTQANALKIATRLDIKGDDQTKYPVDLFFRAVLDKFYRNYKKDKKISCYFCIIAVSNALYELSLSTVSKQSVVDSLLIKLRGFMSEDK